MKHIKMIFQSWKYTKGVRKYYIPIIICSITRSLESLLIPFLISQIIDKAIINRNINLLAIYISIIVCLNIVSGITMIYSQVLTTRLERKITINLRNNCLNQVISKSGDFYTNSSSSDVITLFLQDIESISSILSTQIISMSYNAITLIGVLFLLIWLQKSMFIIVVLFIFIFLVIQKIYKDKIEKATMESRTYAIQLHEIVQELISNMIAFIQNGLIKFQNSKLDKSEESFTKAKVNTITAMTTYNALMSILTGLLMVVIIGWGGYNVIIGTMTIGALFSFQVYAQRVISPVMNLSSIFIQLSSSYVSWSRILELLDGKFIIKNKGKICKNLKGDILFKDLKFGYKQERVLSNFKLAIKHGNTHAIVGPSGAGKTTITHLLFRLWEANEGKIIIDNHNIEEYSLECLRNQISIVSQNIFLLNDTIYNNIALGRKDVSTEDVELVLRQADIYEFVKKLPEGLNTIIGENGIRLSGGEKQRLAIARAIFKNAPILVFDEATSMLDNETENTIIQEVLSLFKNKTIILIAHRLSTVKNADVISVLKNGHIIEEGNHQNLMNLKGAYYNLYTT